MNRVNRILRLRHECIRAAGTARMHVTHDRATLEVRAAGTARVLGGVHTQQHTTERRPRFEITAFCCFLALLPACDNPEHFLPRSGIIL
jgi:hypothetical protein